MHPPQGHSDKDEREFGTGFPLLSEHLRLSEELVHVHLLARFHLFFLRLYLFCFAQADMLFLFSSNTPSFEDACALEDIGPVTPSKASVREALGLVERPWREETRLMNLTTAVPK
jgi:hypothetical protein